MIMRVRRRISEPHRVMLIVAGWLFLLVTLIRSHQDHYHQHNAFARAFCPSSSSSSFLNGQRVNAGFARSRSNRKDQRQATIVVKHYLTISTNDENNGHDDDNETNSPSSETKELLDKAARLRKEVEELEGGRTSSSSQRIKRQEETTTRPAAEYTDVKDSTWLISYRFSDQPENDDEVDDDNSRQQQQRRRFFGGKLELLFRNDGYTDIVAQESTGSEVARITKAWGWDLEVSRVDDDQDYLLFSLDVELPPDPSSVLPTTEPLTENKQRFYFQARQEKDLRNGIISFAEGTVTIKQDVVQKSVRWGFFSPQGILAQFRYVGNFVAKPVAVPNQL